MRDRCSESANSELADVRRRRSRAGVSCGGSLRRRVYVRGDWLVCWRPDHVCAVRVARTRRRRCQARGRARRLVGTDERNVGGAVRRGCRLCYGGGCGGLLRIPEDRVPQYLVSASTLDGERNPSTGGHLARRQQRTAPGVRAADLCGVVGGGMAALIRALRRFVRAQSGAEVIEFALTLPLLLLVVLGIIEFGFMFQEYEVVTNAAREGARIAILPTYSTNAAVTQSNVTTRINQYLSAAGLSTASATIYGGGSGCPGSW